MMTKFITYKFTILKYIEKILYFFFLFLSFQRPLIYFPSNSNLNFPFFLSFNKQIKLKNHELYIFESRKNKGKQEEDPSM